MISFFSLIIILMISIIFVVGYRVSNIYTHLTTPDNTLRADRTYLNSINFNKEQFLNQYHNKTIKLNSSKYNHTFEGQLISPQVASKGTVIMAHGLGGSRQSIYPVADIFLSLGYSVFAIDLPNAGSSTSTLNTFGIRESYDVLDAINYIAKDNNDKPMILWGMSYGAGAAAIAAGRDDSKIDNIILDSPLSDPEVMIVQGLNFIKHSENVPPKLIKYSSELYTTIRYGFSIDSMQADKWLKNTEKPVLILSSNSDKVTPPFMAEALFEASSNEDSRIVKFHNVSHAMLYYDEKERYVKAIRDYLK